MLSLPHLRSSGLMAVGVSPSFESEESTPLTGPRAKPANPRRPSRILSVGDDRLLLYSRRLILETAGYAVESVRGDVVIEEALLRRFDLVLLCHTIDEEVVGHIVEASARIAPQTSLLQISPLDNPFRNRANPALVSADPAALLTAVAGQLVTQKKSNSDGRG